MQSQQKKVKWSRGETADALEERTDTGITTVSVSRMENIVPDVYGNISRRPALKPMPVASTYKDNSYFSWPGFRFGIGKIIPFYYTEDDFFLIGCGSPIDLYPETTIIRIKNGEIVAKQTLSVNLFGQHTSYAQQNNYMVIVQPGISIKLRIEDVNGIDFNATTEPWKYTAGWYAPQGTQTQEVSDENLDGLEFDANTIRGYIYTEITGETTAYSAISTNITAPALNGTYNGPTKTLYLTSWGVYESNPQGRILGTFQIVNGTTYTHLQTLFTQPGVFLPARAIINITAQSQVYISYSGPKYNDSPDVLATVDITSQTNINSSIELQIQSLIPLGSIVQFPNNGGFMRVEGFDSIGDKLYMFGAFLTPVAEKTAKDKAVKIETGYISLQPETYTQGNIYPLPTNVVFFNQRLWAGGWAFSQTDQYSIVFGSQIGRYNDFKNDYNTANEPITLDILTKYKETIHHLIDYNGLKILTDSKEYAYLNGQIIQQSSNGSYAKCEPIIFNSLCLYIEKTGLLIKVMEYELQNNMFNSTTLNQMAQHDLIWYPLAMASYEDKINSTGKYLFVMNTDSTTNPQLAVCNFVPENQATIWNRWVFPKSTDGTNKITHMVDTKTGVIFFGRVSATIYDIEEDPEEPEVKYEYDMIIPMVLDFDAIADYQTEIVNNQVVISSATRTTQSGEVIKKTTLSDQQIDVFDGDEYKFTTTTDHKGYITEDLSEFTNPRAGFAIQSILESHPIDVGGKTYTEKKRIGKCVAVIRDTEPDAFTVCDKTGYTSPDKKTVNFYGCTGMKDQIRYTIKNKKGAKFTIESLTMIIEYGTLDS